MADPALWASALEALIRALLEEYPAAIRAEGGRNRFPREWERVERLLDGTRRVADRMLWSSAAIGTTLEDEVIHLHHAVLHRRFSPTEVEAICRSILRYAARYRPSTLSRVGAFVVRQLLASGRKTGRGRAARPPRADRDD
jgi:hypothetical protein